MIGLDASDAIPISAKTGKNVEAVLEAIVERLPAPKGDASKPLKALLIDSWYDSYLGVVVLVRIVEGTLKKGQRVTLMSTDASYQVERVGVFRPKQEMLEELGPGEVGFFTAAIKQVADTRVGDTVTEMKVGPTEFRLLHFLMTHPERVHSRAQLLDRVWGDHVFIEERTVDVHVKRLREALAPVQGGQLIEIGDGRLERPLRGERADVHLVEDRAVQGNAGPVPIGPVEIGIHDG